MGKCRKGTPTQAESGKKCNTKVQNAQSQAMTQENGAHIPLEKYYKADLPYPEIAIEGECKRYAKLLLHDYAGLDSELSAVISYSHRHLVSGAQSKLIAEAFIGVAIVEMRHLDMLGEAIMQLGMNPKYYTKTRGKEEYWSAENIQYVCDLKGMLKHAIQEEYRAIKQYKEHIACIDDQNIKDLLQRIIEDERLHIKLFKLLLQMVEEAECGCK